MHGHGVHLNAVEVGSTAQECPKPLFKRVQHSWEGSWRLSHWRKWGIQTRRARSASPQVTVPTQHQEHTGPTAPLSSKLWSRQRPALYKHIWWNSVIFWTTYVDRFIANRIYPRVCLRRRASEDLALLHTLWCMDLTHRETTERDYHSGEPWIRHYTLRSHNVWNKSALLVHVSILIFSYMYRLLILKYFAVRNVVWRYKITFGFRNERLIPILYTLVFVC